MPLTFCDGGECLALVQGLTDACFIHPARRWKKLEASGHQGISCVFLGLCFQLIVLVTPGARNQLRFGCSLLKSQCSRSKGRWKKKGALFRKLATWGGGELVSPKPSPSGQIRVQEPLKESFKDVQAGALCRAAQSALTIILKLVMWWSGQRHLDCFKHSKSSTPGSVCCHFLEASPWNCASHRFSTAQDGAAYIMTTVWSSCS